MLDAYFNLIFIFLLSPFYSITFFPFICNPFPVVFCKMKYWNLRMLKCSIPGANCNCYWRGTGDIVYNWVLVLKIYNNYPVAGFFYPRSLFLSYFCLQLSGWLCCPFSCKDMMMMSLQGGQQNQPFHFSLRNDKEWNNYTTLTFL